MTLRAVVLDLDGVIVSTDDCHYRAWQRMADEEGLPFDRERNELLRGVSRMESLALILEQSPQEYTPAETQEMAARKTGNYRDLNRELTGHDHPQNTPTRVLTATTPRAANPTRRASSWLQQDWESRPRSAWWWRTRRPVSRALWPRA